MSYSFSATGTRGSIVDAIVEKGEAAVTQFNDPPAEAAVRDHVGAAASAVEQLVQFVGGPSDELTVSVYGHANPEHAPRSGWSNETCTVQVTVTRAATEPTSPAEATG